MPSGSVVLEARGRMMSEIPGPRCFDAESKLAAKSVSNR
jgi:hypothetical protein